MPGHVQHVVDAAHDPVVAVRVAAGVVAGQVLAAAPSTSTARGSARGRPRCRGACRARASSSPASRLALAAPARPRSTIAGTMPGSGLVQLPGLVGMAPGSGLIMMPPVSVCHQVSTIGQRSPPIFLWYHIQASGLMPFADGAQQSQARQVVLVDPVVAPLDERANRRRRRVEDRDAILLDQFPEAAFVGPVRRAFVHQHRGAGRQRTVDHVAVPGDPADVGRAPEDVLVAMVEDPLERLLRRTGCSRPWCAECPWACRSSRWCTG